MGLVLTTNKKGDYKVTCGISDEKYFNGKAVSEADVKSLLMERAVWKFMEDVVKIDMEFPMGFNINGKYVNEAEGTQLYAAWWLENNKRLGRNSAKLDELIFNKFIETMQKHNIEFLNIKGQLFHVKPNPEKIPAFFEPKVDFNLYVNKSDAPINEIENFLTYHDCAQLINLFQTAPVRESVSVQGLKDVPSGKGSERTTMWSEELAQMLTNKLKTFNFNPFYGTGPFSRTDSWQHLEDRYNKWELVGFSPMLRFMEYSDGGEHYPHYDAAYIYPDTDVRTLKSVVMYLTSNNTGATRFIEDGQDHSFQSNRKNDDWSEAATEEKIFKKVLPVKGKVLIFDHRICHDVDKFIPEDEHEKRIIIRGDLIYKRIK